MMKTRFGTAATITLSLGILGMSNAAAQNSMPLPSPTPTPSTTAAAVPKLSVMLAKKLEQQNGQISREQREQALAKLLEGQRYIWGADRLRSASMAANNLKLARQAAERAVEQDPQLAEGYTTLAELAVKVAPVDFDEAIALANIAIKINPNNFGARRILARVYTIKSRLKTDNFDASNAQQAITQWKEITRLDSRNAEAWAFLSEFYDKTNRTNERISALQNWLSAAAPVETRFYRAVMGAQEDLSPEAASLKLGSTLIKANRAGEAVEVLSTAIADDPENNEAIDLLKQAIDSGASSSASSAATLEALQRAVFTNPGNLALIRLLAQVQVRNGKVDDAIKTLKASIEKLTENDKTSAAGLQVSLGDILEDANRIDEAIAAYELALKLQGIEKSELVTEDDREFATLVFGKIIQTYKNAERLNEARAAIERARVLLGRDDLFADRQLISLMREKGRNSEALQAVRSLRAKTRDDYSLLRLEAQILTEMGKVDEGVALIKPLIGAGKTSSAPSIMYDDFSNYIYISGLYNQAKRGKDAVTSAQKAYTIAESEEKKQIAHLTLASAQQTSGDFKGAEELLRNLLRQTPKNPIALNNLGYFLLEQDRSLDEALKLIKQAVEIDPTNSSYLDSLGWAYYKLGKLGEAELYLKESINNDSSSATVYEHLGDVYQKQGRMELARKTWQKALNLASNAAVSSRIKDKLAQISTK